MIKQLLNILFLSDHIHLVICMLGNYVRSFVLCGFFFKINVFKKNIPIISSGCQTFWIQNRPDILLSIIRVPTVYKGFNRQRIKKMVTFLCGAHVLVMTIEIFVEIYVTMAQTYSSFCVFAHYTIQQGVHKSKTIKSYTIDD